MVTQPTPPKSQRLGVWLFGAYGGLATTVVVGARAIAKGLAQSQGLTTESAVAAGIPFRPLDKLVFGGHEIRDSDYASAASEIHSQTGTLPPELIRALKRDLDGQSKNVVTGVLPNAGATIAKLASGKQRKVVPLRQQIEQIKSEAKTLFNQFNK